MSAISGRNKGVARAAGGAAGPRVDDPRVVRTRAAVMDAARTLFLQKGYAGTTMDEIAERAGLTKRTLYNNYGDKEALFTRIVTDVIAFADAFVRGLRGEFSEVTTAARLRARLDDLAERMALSIVREEVVALRRLLIGESREFQALATRYFERAPAQVIEALAEGFARLDRLGLLRAPDARVAATQYAYLVVGAPLDRALLVGVIPSKQRLVEGAHEGVRTFLARYGSSVREARGITASPAPTAARVRRRAP